MKDNFESALWLMNADGTRQRFLVKGGQRGLVARRDPHRVSRRG